MADYLFIEVDLPKQRKCISIARRCGWSSYEAVGRLVEFWGWLTVQPIELLDDKETGALVDVDVDALVDAGVGACEFFAAMIDADWLAVGEVRGKPSVLIPRFNSWLSKTAKARVRKNLRQRLWRQGVDNVDGNVDGGVGASVDGGVGASKEVRGKSKEERKKGRREAVSEPLDLNAITYPPGFDTPEVRLCIVAWAKYKRRRREAYKSPASQFSSQLRRPDWGGNPDAFCAAVDYSITQNYQGIHPNGRGSTKLTPRNNPGVDYDPDTPCKPV